MLESDRVRDCVCPVARHTHGTVGAYQKDVCRCFPCRIEHSRARASGSVADVDVFVSPTGTQRRIQALHAIGWSESDIAARVGSTKQWIHQLRRWPRKRGLISRTAAQIADIYDDLWDQTPTARNAQRTRNWAERNGFAPPLAWDDDTIDDPAAKPQHRLVQVGPAPERQDHLDYVAELLRAGLTAQQIAYRLSVSKRQVERYKNQIRSTPA